VFYSVPKVRNYLKTKAVTYKNISITWFIGKRCFQAKNSHLPWVAEKTRRNIVQLNKCPMLEGWTLNISLSLFTHSLRRGGGVTIQWSQCTTPARTDCLTLRAEPVRTPATTELSSAPSVQSGQGAPCDGGRNCCKQHFPSDGAVKLTLSWRNVLLICNVH
jgi:hypothetical protein